MSAKNRLTANLVRAARLRQTGQFEAARQALIELQNDPDIHLLGPSTSLGLPRRVQSALLKIAKAEKDSLKRIAYQYHLVPPPALLEKYTRFDRDERRAMVQASRQEVPHIIHQIWIGNNPTPAGSHAWQTHARANGYEYRLWDETQLQEFGINDNPAYQCMLTDGDYPGAVDVARYLILEKYGGIYLDCDWYPTRNDISFHDVLPMTGLNALAERTPRKTQHGGLLLSNALLAAPAQHPVFTRLNTVLHDVIKELPRAPAWWSTGPFIFTVVSRAGPITLVDANMEAGALPQETSMEAVKAWCEQVQIDDRGLLLAWKSWIW